MSISTIINHLEYRGNLKRLTDDEKEVFVKICNSYFFFYDPYKDIFINPITSKNYWPKTLESLFLKSKELLEFKLISQSISEDKFDYAIEKLSSHGRIAINIYLSTRLFKYVGLVIGCLLSYSMDYKIGLAVGLYLMYFDYKIYSGVNGVIDLIEGGIMSSMSWKKNQNWYFLFTTLLLILSFTFIYLNIGSIWLTIGIFLFQLFFLINPIVQYIASRWYRKGEISQQLEKAYENYTRKNEFIKNNPKGIKIKKITIDYDVLCELDEIEECKIYYETEEGRNCLVYLFVYSKEPLKKSEFELELNSDNVIDQLQRLDRDERVEFYYQHIAGYTESTYFVISKDSSMYIFEFEGNYEKNILKLYSKNGNLSDYQEYQFGIKYGKRIEYYDNGQIHLECDFKSGFLTSKRIELKYEDGKIMMTGALRELQNKKPRHDDIYEPNSEFRVGNWKIYDRDSSLIKSVDYKENGEREIIFVDIEKSRNFLWL